MRYLWLRWFRTPSEGKAVLHKVSSQSILALGSHFVENPEVLLVELVWLPLLWVFSLASRLDVAVLIWRETQLGEVVEAICLAQEKLALKELPGYPTAGLAL